MTLLLYSFSIKPASKPNGVAIPKVTPTSSTEKPQPGSANEVSNVDAYKQQKTKSQIKKLEKAREKCGKWIRKLENEEMTLDDLDNEDSNYIKLDRYKKRYMVLRKKIHELQKQKMSLGRRCDKKFKTEGA